MRSIKDRIRHALSFEIIGLVLVTPLAAWLFDFPLFEIGVVALAGSLAATAWNYIYNLGFDIVLERLIGTTLKPLGIRILHAALFELGLLILLLPFVAWYLGISLWHALIMDISFALFYMVYAFMFNWAYDRLFPLPEWARDTAAE